MKTGHLVTEVTGALLFTFELPRTGTFVWLLLFLLERFACFVRDVLSC